MPSAVPAARAEASLEGETLTVVMSGHWRVTEAHPTWSETLDRRTPRQVVLVARGLDGWDSSFALFIAAAHSWCQAEGAGFATHGVPAAATNLAELLTRKTARVAPRAAQARGLPTLVGNEVVNVWRETKDLSLLVGECVFSTGRFFRRQAQFRWQDCFAEMQACGLAALPIVGLISFLVGVTLAYTGAIVVRQYGGDIWIADMVGLAVLREMGPMMAAIVLAGRTGAAYAATLANMKANEEIDALSTLGVSPIDFLVMPRIGALFVMMPFLALYSDGLGILGGMMIAYLPPLNIPGNLFWSEMQTIVDLSTINTGLLKAATFGLLIGLAGCWRGLQAERSSAGVGRAATSAVVTGILLVIVADSIFAVAFDILGW